MHLPHKYIGRLNYEVNIRTAGTGPLRKAAICSVHGSCNFIDDTLRHQTVISLQVGGTSYFHHQEGMRSEERWKLPFTEHLLFARHCPVPRVLQVFKHSILRQYSEEGTVNCILVTGKLSLSTLLQIILLTTNRTRMRTYLSGLPYPHPFTPVPP